jgi:SlyX protein
MSEPQSFDLVNQLVELESRIAFQDDTIAALNAEILEHQKRIERLQRQVLMLADKLTQDHDSGILRPEEEPPPPHY